MSKIGWSRCHIVIVNNPSKWILYHSMISAGPATCTYISIFIETLALPTVSLLQRKWNCILEQYLIVMIFSYMWTLLHTQSFTSPSQSESQSFSCVFLHCTYCCWSVQLKIYWIMQVKPTKNDENCFGNGKRWRRHTHITTTQNIVCVAKIMWMVSQFLVCVFCSLRSSFPLIFIFKF